jgi:uncharacterized integral membrane protein
MTGPAAPYDTASTRPPPSTNGSVPPHPVPQPPGRGQTQTPPSGMRTRLIAGSAVLVVAVIFVIQNAHSANISFLGVHLVLPQAAALLLAAIAGALLMGAVGPARVTRLRQIIRRALARPGPAKQPATNPPAGAPGPGR